MYFLAIVMLFGWIPFTIALFFIVKPHKAVLVSIIGGNLFLPRTAYSFAGLPDFSIGMSIALGLIIGGRLSGARANTTVKYSLYDIPMLVWFCAPFLTSIANHLGIKDGLSEMLTTSIYWGIPYLAGRIYFTTADSLDDAFRALVIVGLLYALLCLYEIKMSPQLNHMIYGFFQSSWLQQRRYGGFRPLVFMQHGLMVSFWMAVATSACFWLWRAKITRAIFSLPINLIFYVLLITTLLCKSVNGWFTVAVGCASYYLYNDQKKRKYLQVLILIIPLYLIGRISGFLSADHVISYAEKVLDPERVGSLSVRLTQEDLFAARALERPLVGWGGYGRNWPVDPYTGRNLIRMVDAWWVILFSKWGYIGLISLYSSLLIGPFIFLRKVSKNNEDIKQINIGIPFMGVVVCLFMIDTLFNAMINNIYMMLSGIVVSSYLHIIKRKTAPDDLNRLSKN